MFSVSPLTQFNLPLLYNFGQLQIYEGENRADDYNSYDTFKVWKCRGRNHRRRKLKKHYARKYIDRAAAY